MHRLTYPHPIVQLSLQSLHLILLVQVLRHNPLQLKQVLHEVRMKFFRFLLNHRKHCLRIQLELIQCSFLYTNHYVIRKSYNTVPPQVDYTLTEFGREASNKMFELVDWLETNLGKILKSKSA